VPGRPALGLFQILAAFHNTAWVETVIYSRTIDIIVATWTIECAALSSVSPTALAKEGICINVNPAPSTAVIAAPTARSFVRLILVIGIVLVMVIVIVPFCLMFARSLR
jgi:hypothetical protein